MATPPSSPFPAFRRNRRKTSRYGVGSLRVWMRKPGLLGMFETHIELSPVNFTKTGMAFRHKHLLNPGQSVILDLKKDHHKLTSIVATVRYINQLSSQFCSGVTFDFSANQHMQSPAVRQSLSEIESLVNSVVILAGI